VPWRLEAAHQLSLLPGRWPLPTAALKVIASCSDQELDAVALLHVQQAAQLRDPGLRTTLRRAWATLAPYELHAGRPVATVEQLLALAPLELAEAVAADLRSLGLVVRYPPQRQGGS
jgi:hypothetical protein